MISTRHLDEVLNLAGRENSLQGSKNQLMTIMISVNPRVTQVYVFKNSVGLLNRQSILNVTHHNNLNPTHQYSQLMKQVDHINRCLHGKNSIRRNERKQATDNLSFYLNKTYKNVLASSQFISTDKKINQ